MKISIKVLAVEEKKGDGLKLTFKGQLYLNKAEIFKKDI